MTFSIQSQDIKRYISKFLVSDFRPESLAIESLAIEQIRTGAGELWTYSLLQTKTHAVCKKKLSELKSMYEFVRRYGASGQETVIKMSEALQSYSLTITYNISIKKFTILGNVDLGRESIEKLFEAKNFQGWQPQVLDETDESGNQMARIMWI